MRRWLRVLVVGVLTVVLAIDSASACRLFRSRCRPRCRVVSCRVVRPVPTACGSIATCQPCGSIVIVDAIPAQCCVPADGSAHAVIVDAHETDTAHVGPGESPAAPAAGEGSSVAVEPRSPVTPAPVSEPLEPLEPLSPIAPASAEKPLPPTPPAATEPADELQPDAENAEVLPPPPAEAVADAPEPGPIGPEPREIISVNVRSGYQVLAFLSKGVEVPEAHVRRGSVILFQGPDGRPFDGRRLTKGLFHVCVQKHKPLRSDLAVYYRGYWYYIPEDDVQSRATLNYVKLVLDMRSEVGDSPVLTLPVN